MKILQVSNNYKIRGGSDSVFFNTSQLLRSAGHEVISFAAKGETDQPSPFSKYFPKAIRTDLARPQDFFQYLYNKDSKDKISELLKVEGPFDVAHLHIYYGRLTTSILAELKRKHIPIIQTLHDNKLVCPTYTMVRDGKLCDKCVESSKLNLLKYQCKDANLTKSLAVLCEYLVSRLLGDVRLIDRFICVSDFQRDLMERGGVPREKLLRLHNFVDHQQLTIEPMPTRSGYLLYFGRIEKLKGLATLVEAAKKAGQHLKIAGTGSWVPELFRSIANNPKIEYLGFVSGLPLRKLVMQAKAVILPSECYDLCPMTILEAKAVGTPVIGSRIGGIPELINDGIDGFLYPPGNEEALIAAFALLDRSNFNDLSQAAKEDILERFSPQVHLGALMNIYSNINREC